MKGREAAYLILSEIEKGAYANIVLDDFLKNNKVFALDRAFVTEIVYGTVKYQQKLDWVIGQLVKKAAKLETGPRILLRMAFYQLFYLDKVPVSAVTNEAVKLAKRFFHQGVAGMINGVLRNYLRNPGLINWPRRESDSLAYLEINYSHPRWMVKRWLERYGLSDTEKLCLFNNEPADLWVRTNTLRIDPQSLAKHLREEGCLVEKSSRIPEGLLLKETPPLTTLSAFREGLFTVQDESSMLVAHVLAPQPGDDVLDVCAGPGGKTTHLAQLMKNRGHILACDIHEHRLRLIEENVGRLGIHIIKTVLQDATRISGADKQYRFILVDAPCSGLGVLRRRPDSRWRKKEQDIMVLASLQLNILENALRLLAPGGRLVYSTCTIEPQENHDVVEKIKHKYPQIRSYDLGTYLPYNNFSAEEKEELQKGIRQYLPFKDKMEGFFIAGLEKVGSS